MLRNTAFRTDSDTTSSEKPLEIFWTAQSDARVFITSNAADRLQPKLLQWFMIRFLCSTSTPHAQILPASPESVYMCVRTSLDVHNLCMTGNVVYAESWHSCFTVTTLFFTLSTVSGHGSPPVHSYPQPPCVYLCSLSRSVLWLAWKFTSPVCLSCVSLCFWPLSVECLPFCTY